MQGICPQEEWDDMLLYLRKQLPITFRINGSGRFADDLRRKLEKDFLSRFSSDPITIEGEVVHPPKHLPWYPDKLAWQLDFSRNQLRKIDYLKDLHEFMKRETDVGAITRQEAVSMIPPMFLDVKPHHRVLDMCAAPGSKTFQLLEALHMNSSEPSGVVVANDADALRCSMLTHQAQRMRSPSIIVTNHDAQAFPMLNDYNPECYDAKVSYDRILCDVPCSGDGTLRKQPDIWRKWTPASGNGLHSLQLRIALRGCELLSVGGRMVYSTCSFNPVEDEAVVAEMLRRTYGGMRLVDVSGEVQHLKYQNGMTSWKVRDKNAWYANWGEGQKGHKLEESMFPQADTKDLQVEHCMRFLPHHQNTGGFFVAVLEKVKDFGRAAQTKVPSLRVEVSLKPSGDGEHPIKMEIDVQRLPSSMREKEDNFPRKEKYLPEWGIRGGGLRNRNQEGGKGSVTGRWKSLDPVVPFGEGEHREAIQTFYGIAPDCNILTSLVSRSTEAKPKKLLYMSKGPKLLLQMDAKEQLKVINAGLKMFERQENRDKNIKCPYRIAQEGLPVLLPYIQKQLIQPSLSEFIAILRDRILSLPDGCKLTAAVKDKDKNMVGEDQEASLIDDKPAAEMQTRECFTDTLSIEQLKNCQVGCCVASLRNDDLESLGFDTSTSGIGGLAANSPFAIPCWRGRGSVNVMVGKQDCARMLERLEFARPGVTAKSA